MKKNYSVSLEEDLVTNFQKLALVDNLSGWIQNKIRDEVLRLRAQTMPVFRCYNCGTELSAQEWAQKSFICPKCTFLQTNIQYKINVMIREMGGVK